MSQGKRVFWFVIMILIGGGLGLYYSWIVHPVEFVDASFQQLRQDYKTDFVLMTAEIYNRDHDRHQAMLRLDKLMEESPEAAVESAIRNAEGFGYAQTDLQKLYQLREALTGERNTPTPQYDPTMEYEIRMTSTMVAVDADADPATQPDSNPFGLNSEVPSANFSEDVTAPLPTETPNPVSSVAAPRLMENPPATSDPSMPYSWQGTSGGSAFSSFEDDASDEFSGIPDDFFQER